MKRIALIIVLLFSTAGSYCQTLRVYRGDTRIFFSSNVAYTVSDGKVYKGNSTSSFDVVYRIKDGKIYKGDGVTFLSADIVYTVSSQ